MAWRRSLVSAALALIAIAWASPSGAAQHPAATMQPGRDDMDNDPCPERALDQSEAHCRRLLAVTERTEGPLSLKTAHVLLALGLRIDEQQRFSEAEPYLRRALAIALAFVAHSPAKTPDEAFDIADHAELFWIGNVLIRNLESQGRPLEADVVASMLRKRDSPDHRAGITTGPYTSVTYVPGVGGLHYQAQIREPTEAESAELADWLTRAAAADLAGRPAEAEPLYRQILSLDGQTFGPAHVQTRTTLRLLAFNLYLQSRQADADQIIGQAGDNGQADAGLLKALGSLPDSIKSRSAPGSTSDAVSPYLIVRNVFEYGMHVDFGADEYERLAATADRQGFVAQAEQIYRAIEQGYAEQGGFLTADVIKYKYLVASTLAQQAKYGQAVAIFRDACRESAERSREAGRGELAGSSAVHSHAEAIDCARDEALSTWGWASAGGGAAPGDRPLRLGVGAFEAAQASLASSAGDALARAVADVAEASVGGGDAATTYELALADRDAVEREISAGGPRDVLTKREADLTAQIANAADALESKAPLYWDYRSPEPLGVGALQATSGPDAALLHANEALVLWMVVPGKDKGLVFAVSKTGFAWAQLGLTGDELTAKVADLRAQLDPQGPGSVSGSAIAGGGAASGGGIEQVAPAGGSAPAHAGFDRTSAYQLYQALLGDAGIQKVIAGAGIDTLLIVPSGPLTSLPPAVLVTEPPTGDDADPKALRGTHWLIRDKAIAVLPAVSSLKTLRELLPGARKAQAKADRPLLALADPDLEGNGAIPGVFPGHDPYAIGGQPAPAAGRGLRSLRASEGETDGRPEAEVLARLGPLVATRAEGVRLMELLGADKDDLLLGLRASKHELMGRQADGTLIRTRVLAFSTHGLVSGDFTGLTEPALVLARPPQAAGEVSQADDQLLRASEVATLKLNADWVVLSACNTAAGQTTGAEGLSGLARAFFFAGAQSLLVSHWRVDDDATERLITDTFSRYRGGAKTKAKALQVAMLAMIDDDAHPSLANPTDWAPFVIVGEDN